MSGRYLLADYKTEEDEKPRVAKRTGDLEKAKKAFEKSSQRKIKSAVLFDTDKNEVLQIAIEGEPIHLVNVIEFARGYLNSENWINFIGEKAAKVAASYVIGAVVKAMAGEAVPGVGGAVLAHVLGPYYAMKGDGAKVAGAGAGLWGGMSGAVVGFLVGGPVGAAIGGAVGGSAAGAAATGIVKALTHPSQCKNCQGTGLVDDFRRCSNCEGYGYHKD